MNTEKHRVIIYGRWTEEFAEGHLNGALSMPHTQIDNLIESRVPDKDTPIALYCRSGGRAGLAKTILAAKKYTTIENLGGLEAAAKKTGVEIVI